jgi:anti-anti-sigma factor
MEELDPQSAAPFEFDVTSDPGGDVLVKVRGELDITAIDALEARVAPLLEGDPPRLVVDASELRFADSSAIALWVRWSAAAREFELRNPPALLRRVIAAMGLTDKLAVTQ